MTRRARSILVLFSVWGLGGAAVMVMAKIFLPEGKTRDHFSVWGAVACLAVGYWMHRRIECGALPGEDLRK